MVNLRANKIYGTSGPDANGSALFNGTDYLTADNATAFRVNQGSGQDFTIEAWIYVTAAPVGANANIASVYVTSGNQRSYMFYVSPDLELKFNYASSGTSGSVSTLNAGTIPTNEWVHVAITNDTSATTARLFKNGLLKDDDTGAHTTYYANTTGDFKVGNDFTGYISNLHINRGTCKYTASFDPYKQPIEVETNTTVLCCNSSTDALNDDKSNSFAQTASDGVKPTSDMPFSRSDAGVVFDGDPKFNTQGHMYFPTGDTSQRGRGRGLTGVGFIAPGAPTPTIQSIQIQSEGIGLDFGDLTVARMSLTPMSSVTRGLFAGGYTPTNQDVIDYVEIATTGNAVDFGNMAAATKMAMGASNSTRGLMAGGDNINTIQYITIASAGNTTDFGDLLTASKYGMGCASPTRAIWFLGSYPTNVNTIEYTTIATTGNSVDFGDRLFTSSFGGAACSSSTRGVLAGGYNHPTVNQSINYVEIATTGNATDFGDLQQAIGQGGSGMSNGSRGVFGGYWGPTTTGAGGQGETNICEYVTIATTGNAKDWGDLYQQTYYCTGVSDSHGGLS